MLSLPNNNNSKTHRIPAKSIPFAPTGARMSVGDRLAISNSIRKAKRFQTVARKRHMTFVPREYYGGSSLNAANNDALPSSTLPFLDVDMTVSSLTGRENPYSRDGQHVRETIELVTSIVQRKACSSPSPSSWDCDDALSAKLERLCVLLSPYHGDGDHYYRHRVGHDPQGDGNSAANYDSSMAGIAANSILSQFITNAAASTGDQRGQHYPQVDRKGEYNNNLAFLFAHTLSQILHSNEDLGNKNNNNNNSSNGRYGVRITAAIIFNQLAATEPPPPTMESSLFNQDEYSPYGHTSPPPPTSTSSISNMVQMMVPPSWCYVLVHSPALLAIVKHIHPQSNVPLQDGIYNNLNDRMQLCEKCILAVGNLAGDSELARVALLREDMGIVPKLMACLMLGLSLMKEQSWKHQQQQAVVVQQQEQQQPNIQTVIDLLRNSMWTIINLLRGYGIASTELLDLQQNPSEIKSYRRLSPYDVGCLLSLSDVSIFAATSSTSTSERGMKKATWDDVANETCWLLSYLTQDNDTSVVEFLGFQWDDFGTNVLSTMIARLAHATDAVSTVLHGRDRRGINEESVMRQMEYLIPCCRTLKHVIIDSDDQFSRFMDKLFLAKTATMRSENPAICNGIRPFETSIAKLISLGTLGAGSFVSNIASEAASLAGTSLYDAGIEPNSAASMARGTLLPALCHAIISPLSTFDFQREVVWAIWYTVGLSREVMSQTLAVQSDLVRQFIHVAPPDMGMARALTTILSTMDADVTEASLRLIDLLLRWYRDGNGSGSSNTAIIFEEAGLVDALWRVCDSDTDESEVAELAAKILDDFYDQDEKEEEDEIGILDGQFQFQVSKGGIPEGGFNFGSAI